MWQWWTHSDAGLWTRITLGTIIFLVLAMIDWTRNGRHARRWREYLFLLLTVAVAMMYGMANDQITSTISWEYFYYGKGLAEVLDPMPLGGNAALRWEAAKVGMKATWTAGLLIGVALLLANNPGKQPQLSYRRLARYLVLMLACAIVMAALFGIMGYAGWPARWSEDFRQMIRHDEFRPYRFMCVYGIHLGGYIGGLLGTTVAVLLIRRKRRRVHSSREPSIG